MNRTVLRTALAVLLSAGALPACTGEDPMEAPPNVPASVRTVPDGLWQALAGKTIFFGHQSVGYNILDGVRTLMAQDPRIDLTIVENADPAALDRPVFAHARVGRNSDPASKCRAFAEAVESGIGGRADIAFFKFCYVDIKPGTDIQEMFVTYRDTMRRLQAAHPGTLFVHSTVPLTTLETGPKAWIKALLGRPVRGVQDNILRCRFNDLLREAYEGREPLFDLARAESTAPDGRRATFRRDGATYFQLVPAYTSDGGHLNALGQERVASELLLFLAGLPGASGPGS